jgi:hypothetical protein
MIPPEAQRQQDGLRAPSGTHARIASSRSSCRAPLPAGLGLELLDLHRA